MIKFIKELMLPKIARRVRNERLTYLSVDKLSSLAKEVSRIKKQAIKGEFIELGVAMGGSAIFLATEAQGRIFTGYDVFGMIPPPSDKDEADSHLRYDRIASGQATGLKGDDYYGYVPNLLDKVSAQFTRYGVPVDQEHVRLKPGLFENSLHFELKDVIALAHIDCDWYDPVKLSIERIMPNLALGGVIIVDDYNDYIGCKKAVTEMIDTLPNLHIIKTDPHAVLMKI